MALLNDNLKICIVCSAGGHFSEAIKATEKITHDKYYVTYYADSLKDYSERNRMYFITHPKHGFFILRSVYFLLNCFQSIWILLRERPDIIISTGADVAVATCIFGKIMRKKLIYIESGGYVTSASMSGRIVYPFADLFIVQWKPALKKFPRAIYGGPLF